MTDIAQEDLDRMKQYGFIYADGSYSDERLPKGAILVPRRPSPEHQWDMGKKQWVKATKVAKAPEPVAPAPLPAAEVPAVPHDPDQDPAIAKMLGNTLTPAA